MRKVTEKKQDFNGSIIYPTINSFIMPKVIITDPGENPESYRFKLKRDAITIGRGSSNDIVTKCRRASKEHCVIERVEGGYIMRDLASTNGIELKKTIMEVVDLKDGTKVLIGDAVLHFKISAEEREELSEQEFISCQKKKKLVGGNEDEVRGEDRGEVRGEDRGAKASREKPPGEDVSTLLKTLLKKFQQINWGLTRGKFGSSVGELGEGKKADLQGEQGVSGILLAVVSVVIFFTLYKLQDDPAKEANTPKQGPKEQAEEMQDQAPPAPLEPDSIELTPVIWLNADENENMRVMFKMTNKNPYPVSEIPVRFSFYDVLNKELGGSKTIILSDPIGAGEQRRYRDFALGAFPLDTIKVLAEVIAPSEDQPDEVHATGHPQPAENAAVDNAQQDETSSNDDPQPVRWEEVDPFEVAGEKAGEAVEEREVLPE